MKKIIIYIALFAGCCMLFRLIQSTVAPALDKTLVVFFNKKISSGSEYKTKKECISHGGLWGKAGIFPKEFCRIPSKDGGKTCLGGFQCETGSCIIRYAFRDKWPFATGQCTTYVSTFGCIQQIHFGLKDQGICLD